MIIDVEGLKMAAYQCLNCGQIERSDVDCCENPDLVKINDMPAEIKRLRAALEAATRPPVKPDRYAWYQYMDHGNGMGWIERVVDHDPRTPEYAEMYHRVDWADSKQVRNFRALYTKPPAQTV